MDLGGFIVEKLAELSGKWKGVELKSIESVVLSKNSVASEFNSKETSLLQKGKEVKISDMEEVSSLPFVPNGTVVRFYYKQPRMRKPSFQDFYFLWEKTTEEKTIPVIVLKHKEKESRYLASSMDFGDWEDPDLDVKLDEIECAYMIWREDLSVLDETDVEEVKKFSAFHKQYMIDKFGKDAIVSFDMEEILKVYVPVNIEIPYEKFKLAKSLNE